MSMEPGMNEIYWNREQEVPAAEKQRLFLQALDIMLIGDSERREMVEGDKVFVNAYGRPGHFSTLEMNDRDDEKWVTLREVGLRGAALCYWPERSHGGMTHEDQVNLELFNADGSFGLYTMRAFSNDANYRVALGNRLEIQNLGIDWLEVSRADADRVGAILTKIQQTLGSGLAS